MMSRNVKRIVPESIIHPRWLVKIYRRLRQGKYLEDDELTSLYDVRTVQRLCIGRTKTEREKFNELFGLERQIADVGSRWGTRAHETLSKAMMQFLENVKAGQCPTVNVLGDSERNLNLQLDDGEEQRETEGWRILVLRTQLQLSLKPFHNLNLIHSFRVLDANTDDQDMEEVRLYPKGRALLSLIEEMEDDSTNSDQCTTRYECESEIMSWTVDQSETVHQAETGYQSETVDQSETLCEAETVNHPEAAEQSENDDQDVAVVSGRTAFDVNTLKAMPTWHTAVSHFDIIDEATNGWEIWITLNGNHVKLFGLKEY
ncbi:hypothetical protein GN958_ATG04196 [Phytophthora infestans]|uniref:Uncharacterized protein n=1 Tax=Phytophthora infestans TaxID=4787 RepID=A0A8S9V5W7_PHYIN|nr:hypothetical protein GN958_ATG04196 [Phytophthora infestans]